MHPSKSQLCILLPLITQESNEVNAFWWAVTQLIQDLPLKILNEIAWSIAGAPVMFS